MKAGAKTADFARKHGVSEATLYNWKAKCGGMGVWMPGDQDGAGGSVGIKVLFGKPLPRGFLYFCWRNARDGVKAKFIDSSARSTFSLLLWPVFRRGIDPAPVRLEDVDETADHPPIIDPGLAACVGRQMRQDLRKLRAVRQKRNHWRSFGSPALMPIFLWVRTLEGVMYFSA